MPHNGSKIQTNLQGLNFGGDYAFINRVKDAGRWNGNPLPTDLTAAGYPTALPVGLTLTFQIPTQADRPGNYICRWEGGGPTTTISTSFSGSTALTGSKTGADGQFTCLPTIQSINLGISVLGSAPLTNLEFFHKDDEASLDAGNVFGDRFKAKLADFGVIRFLNWQLGNGCGISKWAERKPVDYMSYGATEYRASLYRGTTGGVADAYTCDLGDGGTPIDKDIHILRWNASSLTLTPTLNGKLIKSARAGGLFSTEKPLVGRQSTVFYDADLDCWLKREGDATGSTSTGLRNGVPPELMLQLCKEVGAHPWFTMPYLSLDPMTDYTTELATLCKAYAEANATWMVPRFEPANEVWNGAQFYDQTNYGTEKATDHWGVVPYRVANWYGKVLSTMGEAISIVYGGNRTKYQVCCGVWTSQGATPNEHRQRMESALWVAQGGGRTPASDWATHVSIATYINPPLIHTTSELSLAYGYSIGDAEAQASYAEAWAADVLDAGNFSIPTVLSLASSWKNWATGYGMAVNCYEGDWSAGYDSVPNIVGVISGATKATNCVLTIATTTVSGRTQKPAVGMSITIASVAGMTQLNGNTYTVTQVSGNNVTINVNSTAFSTYTSGGTATYVGSAAMLVAIRTASKSVPDLFYYSQRMIHELATLGIEYHSLYQFSGSGTWGTWQPDIYITQPARIEAIQLYNANKRRYKLTVAP